MNEITAPNLCALTAFALLLLPPAQVSGEEAGEPARKIAINSYAIEVVKLAEPRVRIDEEGIERSYDQVWVVTLEGYFGEPRAIPLEIYVGDYRIPEYAGSEDVLYFEIYEEELLDELEGQPFGFGALDQKAVTLDLLFTPSALRPFEERQEPPADE